MRGTVISAVRYLFQAFHNGLPGVLASVIGALVMSYMHWGPSASMPAPHSSLTAEQRLQIAQMVKEEHTLLIDFLKKQEQREAAAARTVTPQTKVADSEPALPAEAAAPRPPVKPKVAMVPPHPVAAPVIVESGPLVAPAVEASAPVDITPPREPGWTERMIAATHVLDAASFVLDIPGHLGRTLGHVTIDHGLPTAHLVRASW